MSDPRPGSLLRSAVVPLIALLLAPLPSAAGSSERAPRSGAAAQPASPPAADFLFGQPRTVLGIAGGWLAGTDTGDLFDFVQNELTIEDGDFDTVAVRLSAGRALTSRLDLLAEVGFSQARVQSEYREFVEDDGLPITQATEFTRVPVQGSIRLWLVPRGRQIGRFAWVPRRMAPFVGAGGGGQWYQFQQFGDFVDFVDLSIFTNDFRTSGWAWSGHVFGGGSIAVRKQMFLTLEARQAWARTRPSDYFVGFDTIELSGLRITGGLEFVF